MGIYKSAHVTGVASRGTLAISITLWKIVIVYITWRNSELNSVMSNTFAFTFRRLGSLGAHTLPENAFINSASAALPYSSA